MASERKMVLRYFSLRGFQLILRGGLKPRAAPRRLFGNDEQCALPDMKLHSSGQAACLEAQTDRVHESWGSRSIPEAGPW